MDLRKKMFKKIIWKKMTISIYIFQLRKHSLAAFVLLLLQITTWFLRSKVAVLKLNVTLISFIHSFIHLINFKIFTRYYEIVFTIIWKWKKTISFQKRTRNLLRMVNTKYDKCWYFNCYLRIGGSSTDNTRGRMVSRS